MSTVDRSGTFRWRWVIGLAVCAAAAIILAVAIRLTRPASPELQELIAAVAKEPTRPVEGRLAGGFSYRPIDRLPSTPGNAAARPTVVAAANQLKASMTSAVKPRDMQSLAVADLLAGDSDSAVSRLQQAAAQGGDAGIQNDLAVAFLARSATSRRWDDYDQARAAAESAVTSNPRLLEARFNVALARERVGDRAAAIAGWRDYLALDGNSPWAVEARQHLGNVQSTALFFRTFVDIPSPVDELTLQFESGESAQVRTGGRDYPASFYAMYSGGHCTATFVGAHVALTAAHCFDAGLTAVHFDLGGTALDGDCVLNADYDEAKSSGDWALCYFSIESPAKPYEVLNTSRDVVPKGGPILATGFGGGSGGSVKFRPFVSTIKVPPTPASDVIVLSDQHLEGRDSGGSAFAYFGGSRANRAQVATNSSRSSVAVNEDRLCGFASDLGKKFLQTWKTAQAAKPDAWICGAYSTGVPQTNCRNAPAPNSFTVQ